ncbi:MAG: hypothetical protein IPG02_17580 [Ignavibacteria bacterium]|nr:hypothetical protein [Ignavibacteria bacterium]
MSAEGSGDSPALEHNYSSFYYMPDVPAQAKPFTIKQMQSTNALVLSYCYTIESTCGRNRKF